MVRFVFLIVCFVELDIGRLVGGGCRDYFERDGSVVA